MNKKSILTQILCIAVGSLLFTAGCSKKPHYPHRTIAPLLPEVDYRHTKHDVTLRAKKLNKQDCIQTFGKTGNYLANNTSRSYHPIQLSITNNSQDSWILSPKNIDLRLVSSNRIAARLKKNTLPRAIGIGIGCALGGLLLGIVGTFGAMAVLSAFGLMATGSVWFASMTMSLILVSSSPFLFVLGPINATKDGLKSIRKNKQIDHIMSFSALNNGAAHIAPDQTIDLLIFTTKKEFKPQFNVRLTNHDNDEQTVSYMINLKQHILRAE